MCVSGSIVKIKDNRMQKLAMTFLHDRVAIYLNSLACGIVVAYLIWIKFGTE